MRPVVSLLALLALAACVSPPKPFEHDTADDAAYRAKRDKTEIVVAPPAYMPPELGRRVAAALAVELQSYGVVAAVPPAAAPMKLSGAMRTRDAEQGIEIEIEWRIDGGPRTRDSAIVRTRAQSVDYAEASDRLVSRIAQQAAPRVATLMGRQVIAADARSPGQVAAGLNVPPPTTAESQAAQIATALAVPTEAAPGEAKPAAATTPTGPQVKVVVAAVTGAPSDGNRQLFSGMRRALGSSKIVVSDGAGPDTFTVQGAVSVTPVDDRTVQLAVTWVLKDPSGKEVGKVEQSNPVPAAATRGSWAGFGDIVADAAVEGILQLLDKALSRPR
jgi:hypothetical protein